MWSSDSDVSGGREAHRDASLQLIAVVETNRKAFRLVLEALELMDKALEEQGQIIAGLLVGEVESVNQPGSSNVRGLSS